jgi:alpha-tubulin suppressor-like RCC1 family protein
MFGHALCGQLGLGDDCIDRAFKPERVSISGIKVQKVALGDTHSIILTTDGNLMTTGANDKY